MEQLLDAGLLEEGPPGAFRMHELLRAHARRAAPRTAHQPTVLRPPRREECRQPADRPPAALR